MASNVLPAGTVLPPPVRPDEPTPMPSRPAGRKAVKSNRSGSRKGKRRPGRFPMVNAFIDTTMQTVKPSVALVWLTLWRDEKHGTVRTGVADLARRMGVDRSTVLRGLAELRERGLVEVVHHGGIGRGVNTYKLKAN